MSIEILSIYLLTKCPFFVGWGMEHGSTCYLQDVRAFYIFVMSKLGWCPSFFFFLSRLTLGSG